MGQDVQEQKRQPGMALVEFLVALPGALPLYWFWSRAQFGNRPPLLAWIAAGIGMTWISLCLAMATSNLLGRPDDWGGGPIIILTFTIAPLVAAVLWVQPQHDPLETLDSMIDTLGPACRGVPVTGTGDSAGPAPRRIVVLSNTGNRIEWSGIGSSWRATKVEEAALVACVDRKKALVETCRYSSHYQGEDFTDKTTRYADVASVRVVAARTGQQVANFVLRVEPRACEESTQDVPEEINSEISFDALSTRLESYAAG